MEQATTGPTTAVLRLQPGQTMVTWAKAGTWLQVRHGTLVVAPVPRWLAETMQMRASHLGTGAGQPVDDDGWLRLHAQGGPVELHCRVPAPAARPALLAPLARWLRGAVRRRLVSS